MIATWMNLISLFALALAGSGLVMAGRRLMAVIRVVERKLSRAVDEKNMVAAALRHAKKEDAAIRQALDDAERHITQMQGVITMAETRIERLRASPRRVVSMLDRQWNRFDRLWCVKVTNPSLGSGHGGAGGWVDGKTLYGFARSGDDLVRRVAAEYSPGDGFLLGTPMVVDLADDGSGSNAVDQSKGAG
ncbi:hypothetical protein [Niveispirillum cyanobacteriorum]|uniref:Uncharacterized protein n=1 Tax=Niveispirillum cyanobacteriorum TaxID=1612173 RepID=A0A2K9NG70_9PROT|nr:hypothetical protein [Niveispirillum cyanobacteriorum]AUN32077.1 hypothetical protein C0V82_16805 [Niveispirillum cyanobacteriorum]GGE74021.1 hypothetical protein GCM10011317_33910 [Niveispirillum cyanobacteriorum]